MEVIAYIDPGLGSYLFQITIAGFLAAGFIVRAWGRRVSHWIRRKR
jgi:hypothetical protein